MNGVCKLCLAADSELRHSHIIPEFNYTPCYDDKHRLSLLSSLAPEKVGYEQKGYREYLLCQKCETQLSVWEQYASRVLSQSGVQVVEQTENGCVFGGVDYERFKLYGLSLIWRMGVSSHPFFREVNLGPHTERLRLALVAGNPLAPEQYPVLVTAVTFGGKFYADLVIAPSLTKVGANHVYRTVIGGLVYSFFVGSKPISPSLLDFALARNGTFTVPVVPIGDLPFLREPITEIARVLNKRDPGA